MSPVDRERRAWICTHQDHVKEKFAYRVFTAPGDPEPPRCPEHGKMTRQANVTYDPKPKKRRK